ncbi:M48 family metalloprotease [Undibacterium crateris]|uniref:M48 family metalloprotease n=1 Tax=Undibacterium crateris TaxID=2528175 RepID=UPI001389E407|nr:M48 family metalloprotease [Undibacterium crateris]NDI86282.1 M48 family metalloprotease [Undibacterium crateris]
MSGVYPAVSPRGALVRKKIAQIGRLATMGLLVASCIYPAGWSASVQAQNLPNLGDTAREDLSPLMERRLGEQIMSSVRRDPDYMDDGPISEYLNRLGNRMLDARPDARGEQSYDFEFFAVRDPVLNAFAFPGGFIGFHSGLILSAQSESELASVMGHEIGHVAQRHIARMIAGQKYDAFIPLAALALAILAARSSPDAAMAVAAGGQGLAIQKQLNFSREAEREADRIGFQILRDAGFDTNGMVAFFGRLQASMRNYTDNAPAYLRSHPLTSDRIADIQARVLDQRYRQVEDSIDFFLMKARIRVLQDTTVQGLMDSKAAFELQIKSERSEDRIAATYGLAFVALKQLDTLKAQSLYNQARKLVEQSKSAQATLTRSSMFASLAIDIAVAEKRYTQAIADAEKFMQLLPLSRGLVYQYAEALIAAKLDAKAEGFLRDQVVLYRQDARLQNLLAKVYAAQGKQALQHIALAEAYAIQVNWKAAMQQLELARREKDAQYYELSVIDAREREWKEAHKDELLEKGKK